MVNKIEAYQGDGAETELLVDELHVDKLIKLQDIIKQYKNSKPNSKMSSSKDM